jgi:hypothetical protein
MSSDAHLRRDHGTVTPNVPYIDWGPDLPARYAGGRARLLVANPRTLYLTWETAASPGRWRVEVEGADGALLQASDLAGGRSDAWLHVGPRMRGRVHLARDGERVATLPFATPPDAPSERSDERWGIMDAGGHVVDAVPLGGRALGVQAGPSGVPHIGYWSSDPERL